MKRKCDTCEDLESEKVGTVIVTDVKILGVGYYHWGCKILYCPVCGKKLKYKGEKLNETSNLN